MYIARLSRTHDGMAPPRKHALWNVPEEEFREIVEKARSVRDILNAVGVEPTGYAYNVVKARMHAIGVPYRKFLESQWAPRPRKLQLEEILVRGSRYPRSRLKTRLIEEGVFREVCEVCGQGPLWYGSPLVLVLDSKNGISTDLRRENLRFLCPNCHSQIRVLRAH